VAVSGVEAEENLNHRRWGAATASSSWRQKYSCKTTTFESETQRCHCFSVLKGYFCSSTLKLSTTDHKPVSKIKMFTLKLRVLLLTKKHIFFSFCHLIIYRNKIYTSFLLYNLVIYNIKIKLIN